MTKAEKIRDDRSDRPGELIFGIVISLLLHVVLWLGRNHWLQAVAPRQQPAPEIPVEFVEVPPSQTKPPPETSRRAANDSVAGGEAKPQKPLTAIKPTPATPKTSNSNSPNPPAPKPQPPKAIAPKPQNQPSPPQRTATAPATPQPRLESPPQPPKPPAPKPQNQPSPPQRTATAPATPPPQPTLPKPVPTPTTPLPASPPSPQSKPQTPTAPTATNSNPLPRQQPTKSPATSSPPRQAAKTTPSKPTQSAPASGAASKLGGPVSLSQRQPGDSSQAALPNTNRSNPGEAGIDARQEVDLGSYLEQLRQRVRRQWIPGITQSSRRTVIHFAVNRSGQISQVRVAQPSGFSVTDQAALNAVQRAAPFAPLPPEYTDNYIQIRFTFNINVSGELELWGGG